MDEEDLAGLPSFRVIRVSTEAQDYRSGPEGQAHELDLAERRTGTAPTGLELRDASPGWDAGRLEPALAWAAEGRVKVGLVPYFSRFMRDPALAFAFRDAFHARGCVLYFADRRLLSSDLARQGRLRRADGQGADRQPRPGPLDRRRHRRQVPHPS
jgi:hypothetical protein